mmetsp:Transcript_18511/g.43334  ORF Transcript_18511/g.43334 Transcript_18511/m.43334 type:complete len:209 (+) Transcript_18511:28-654(+)
MATETETSGTAFWVGTSILALGAAVLVGWNVMSWYAFASAAILYGGVHDGKCALPSTAYTSGLKTGHSSFGRQWTDVPCWTQVQIFDESGDELFHSRAGLSFEYEQGAVWDYVHDSCADLLPPRQQEHRFDCCFNLGEDGKLASNRVFDGVAEKLPPLRRALFVHAAGLSFMTLSPVLLLLWCSCRGRRSEAKVFQQTASREPLLDGI